MGSKFITSLPIIKTKFPTLGGLRDGGQRILPGDSMDVNLLSMAIPLSLFVLTDKKMEARIKRLKIDIDWGAKVFSMSTIDELFAEMESLR